MDNVEKSWIFDGFNKWTCIDPNRPAKIVGWVIGRFRESGESKFQVTWYYPSGVQGTVTCKDDADSLWHAMQRLSEGPPA